MSEQQSQRGVGLAGPVIMLISAALFGYFGFTTRFVATSGVTGQLLIYVPMLEWTLKISAIAFLICAGVVVIAPVIGNVIYSLVGLVGAVMFVLVAIMDLADQQHMVMSPLWLLVFAAWNGYGSWTGLQAVLALRRSSAA
jgi:hypothetical protein